MTDLTLTLNIVASFVGFIVFGAHTVDAALDRKRYHDDRSAHELLLHLTLTIMAGGLLFSAAAAVLAQNDPAVRTQMRDIGLGLTRYVMVVLALVTLWTDHRSGRPRRTRREPCKP